MTKFRTLVESALKDYVESVPEEVLDEDFKSGFKKALGTALVGGMLAAPSMFGQDKAKMIADLNAGVEGDLPTVVDVLDLDGHFVVKYEDGGTEDLNTFAAEKDKMLKDKQGIY